MKNCIVAICLIAQLTPYFVGAQLLELESKKVKTGITPNAAVTWTQPCAQSAGGPGNAVFRALTFNSCTSNKNCTVTLNKLASGALGFILNRNETSLTLSVTAFALTPKNNPTNIELSKNTVKQNFTAKTIEYLFPYNFTFLNSPYLNKNGTYQIELKMGSPSTMHICRTYTVYFNEKFVPNNTASAINATCSTLNEPCTFNNSMCLQNQGKNTCQCDQYSLWDGSSKSCKKKVGNICEKSGECVTKNADCLIEKNNAYGYCTCKKGYVPDPKDALKCKSGSSAMLPIFLLVAIQVLFVFWNKSG